jgi:hypothetical protein
MQTLNNKNTPAPDDGAGEPMMFVAALAVATWLGYAFYADRIFPPDAKAAQTSSRTVSSEANAWLHVAPQIDRKS